MIRLRASHLVPLAVLALAAGLPAAAAAPAAAASTTYTVTNMGSLGDGGTQPEAINASGQVTGFSFTSTVVTTTCAKHKACSFHPEHAFLWSNGTMTDLGSLVGADGESEGLGINSSGEVAGLSGTATSGVSNAVLWTGTTMVDLGALAPLSSGLQSQAGGINDSGQVTGFWVDSTGADHPFLYSNGTMTSLPEPSYATAQGARGCLAGDINNSGLILGQCIDASDTDHSVLWQNGTVTTLSSTLGSLQDVFYFEMNNNGQFVGQATTTTGATVGFLDSNGTVTNLGSFIPFFLNDNDVMLDLTGDIDSGGTVQNLDNLLPDGWDIAVTFGINDNGQIIAKASVDNDGTYAGLLLTPN